MKTMKINQLVLFTALLVIISACSTKSGGDYTKAIPSGAQTVVVLDFHSMGNKAGLNDKDNQAFQQKMLQAMTSGLKPASVSHLEKIMKDPSESGFSSKDPVYVFVSPVSNDAMMVMKVGDENKVRSTLDVMAQEQIGKPVTEKDGLNWMKTNDMFIAYNSTSAIVGRVNRNFTEEEIAGYLNAKPEESIQENSYFQDLQKKKGDILFFTSLGSYTRHLTVQMGASIPAGVDLNDLFILGDMSFEKGKIVSHFEYAANNEEMKQLLTRNNNSFGKIKGTFLDRFPVSPLMFVSFNANGEQLLKGLMENEALNKAMQGPEGTLAQEFIKSMNGDVSFGLLDMNMMDIPFFVAYGETTRDDALDFIYQNKRELGITNGNDVVQLSAHQYQFKPRSGKATFYFGVKDKVAYITNDVNIHNGTKNYPQLLKDARYASAIKGKGAYFVLDIEAILAMPVVRMAAGFGGGQVYLDKLSKFSYMEATSVDPLKTEVTLYMTDKDTNTLKQIVDMVKQFSGM